MQFILGTKVEMTEHFSEKGVVSPVSVVLAGPVTVLRIFNREADGYDAVQVGFGLGKKMSKKASKKSKKRGKNTEGAEKVKYKTIKEFRLKAGEKVDVKVGDQIDVSVFTPGDKLQVSSISKGKGFQGVVKRHGFHGGPRTHGQKHSEREPGSIGGGLRTRVPKGMRMAGRMGGDRITQKNLKVVAVDKESNTLLIRGAIAGRRGTLIEIISRSEV